ncbi:metallophosphoesterase family protein [Corynebacterium appendicis]|uniref:metallophosphoesterase family protein n=1 Tax=Corynebacterium appendicis TaxID=163202 RepID=UPI00254C1D53|nr:metallophosphoesterase family protein [Corynebacterium appendicis]MDK8625887.1 metallophosphoesterase family protein [Corynebacterium appendicis]
MRLKTTAAAAALTLTLTLPFASVPDAVAQSSSGSNPVTVNHIGVGATSTDMNFSWRTNYRGAEFVKYYPSDRPDAAQTVPAEEARYGVAGRSMHASISGLQPGLEYTYQLGSDMGGWSEPETFRVQPEGDSWSFLNFADAQIGVDLKVREQADAWRAAVKQATSNYPDSEFILHAGDQTEGWGSPTIQWEAFFSPEELRNYPVAMSKGNHETYALPGYFDERRNFPNQQGSSANYFFERNNALFVVLDSNESFSRDIQRHADFVRKTVTEHGTDKDWIIAVMHHAPYAQSSHAMKDSDVKRLREGLAPVFSEAGVDMVMSGHDHMYNRTHLMNGLTPTAPDAYPASGDVLKPKAGEVMYVTTTTAGGGKYYNFHSPDGEEHPQYTSYTQTRDTGLQAKEIAIWTQDKTPDYAVVEVDKNTLTMRTFNVADNSLVDEFTLDKSSTDRPAPGTRNPGVVTPGGAGEEGSSGSSDNSSGEINAS